MAATTEAVVLGADAAGRPIVSLHAKRTFKIRPDGRCEPAETPMSFVNFEDPAANDAPEEVPESDLLPFKAHTDLIVLARAYARPRQRTVRSLARIEVGTLVRDHVVIGDRRCLYRGPGEVAFSDPEPFEAIDLTFENAYGGVDPTFDMPAPVTLLDALERRPCHYPRNPVGRGYVVTGSREHVDGLRLPNLEKPDDRLTPERFFVGQPSRWWRQPLPWSCDAFDRGWYPRCVYSGVLPDHLPEDDREMPEVKLGLLAAGSARRIGRAPLEELLHPRLGDAAAPGLVLPLLRGDEAIRFTGMTPSGSFVVKLPGAPPRFTVRWKGRAQELAPVPHRIVLSLEKMGLTIVWQAGWPAPKEFIELVPRPGEPLTAGIDHLIDERPVELII